MRRIAGKEVEKVDSVDQRGHTHGHGVTIMRKESGLPFGKIGLFFLAASIITLCVYQYITEPYFLVY